MKEAPIGIVWRFGRNDYQISLFNPTPAEEEDLNRVMKSTENSCTCIRGDAKLSLNDADVKYWEDVWAKEEVEAKRKQLAKKLYRIGLLETDALYDNQADEQLTEEQIVDVLDKSKDTAYMLETFLQFCDGGQEKEDHEKFFEAAMDIVHYMEEFQKGEN